MKGKSTIYLQVILVILLILNKGGTFVILLLDTNNYAMTMEFYSSNKLFLSSETIK